MKNWTEENDRDSEQNLLDVNIDDADMADEPGQNEESDLPQDFTRKIMSVIKRQVKEKDRDQENVHDSSLSAEEPIDAEDSPEDNGNRKRPQKNKSKNNEEDWKEENNDKPSPKAKRGRPRKILTDTMNRQEKVRDLKTHKDERDYDKKMNKMKVKLSLNSNPSSQPKKPIDLNQIQKTLKTYFESYLTTILDRMQDITNDKLAEISSKLRRIQAGLPSQQQQPQQSNGIGLRQTYTKLQTKLSSINRIEKGESTIADIARELNISSKVVQSWLVNKQQLREEAKKRNKK